MAPPNNARQNNTGTSGGAKPATDNSSGFWQLANGLMQIAGTETGSAGVTSQFTPSMQALLDSLAKAAAENTVATEKAANVADYTKQKAVENTLKLMTGFYQGADAAGITDMFKAIAPAGSFLNDPLAGERKKMQDETVKQAALSRREDYARTGISLQNAQLQQLLAALQLEKGAVTVQEQKKDTPLNTIGNAIEGVFKSIF